MTVKRMDNVGIVVEDLDAAIEFFTELGLELEGRAPIEGDWADGVTGLRDMRVEMAMMRTEAGTRTCTASRVPRTFPTSVVPAAPRLGPVSSSGADDGSHVAAEPPTVSASIFQTQGGIP